MYNFAGHDSKQCLQHAACSVQTRWCFVSVLNCVQASVVIKILRAGGQCQWNVLIRRLKVRSVPEYVA